MRRRSGWVLPILLVLLVTVPIFEVWLFIQVCHQIGIWPTIAILVAEAALGAWLMRREGNRAWKALSVAFETGRMPTGELADAALILVGGVLLMLPGFATDVVGFFCLLPFTRSFARRFLGFLVARRLQRLGVPVMVARQDKDGLIEGEVVDGSRSPSKSPPNGPQIISGEIVSGTVDEGRP